jgi:hypothetical protein
MTRVRLALVVAVAALFFAVTGTLAAAGTTNHSNGHSAAPALQAEATSTTDSCKTVDVAEGKDEKAKETAENKSEKAAKLSKAADATEDKKEKADARAEDKSEGAQLKACEAARKANQPKPSAG